MENDFFSKIFAFIGTVFSGIILIGNIVFRSDFGDILGFEEDSIFNSLTTIASVIGVAIMLGLYANRYRLNSKVYPNRNASVDYKNKLAGNFLEGNERDYSLREPLFFYFKDTSWVGLIMSTPIFFIILQSKDVLVKGTLYLLFFNLLIYAFTIFILDIYMEYSLKQTNEVRNDNAKQMISNHFAPHIKYHEEYEYYTEAGRIARCYTVEVEKNKYEIRLDFYNPSSGFQVKSLNDNTKP